MGNKFSGVEPPSSKITDNESEVAEGPIPDDMKQRMEGLGEEIAGDSTNIHKAQPAPVESPLAEQHEFGAEKQEIEKKGNDKQEDEKDEGEMGEGEKDKGAKHEDEKDEAEKHDVEEFIKMPLPEKGESGGIDVPCLEPDNKPVQLANMEGNEHPTAPKEHHSPLKTPLETAQDIEQMAAKMIKLSLHSPKTNDNAAAESLGFGEASTSAQATSRSKDKSEQLKQAPESEPSTIKAEKPHKFHLPGITSKEFEHVAAQLTQPSEPSHKKVKIDAETPELVLCDTESMIQAMDTDNPHQRQLSAFRFMEESVRTQKATQAQVSRFCDLLQRRDVFVVASKVVPELLMDKSVVAHKSNPMITQILQRTKEQRSLSQPALVSHGSQTPISPLATNSKTSAASKRPKYISARLTQVEDLNAIPVQRPDMEMTLSALKVGMDNLRQGHLAGLNNKTTGQQSLPRRDETTSISRQDMFRTGIKEMVALRGEPWEPAYCKAQIKRVRERVTAPEPLKDLPPMTEEERKLWAMFMKEDFDRDWGDGGK